MTASYAVLETDAGTGGYGARYYNDYQKRKIPTADYNDKYVYYREGGQMDYDSLEEYRNACDDFGYYRSMTMAYAKMVNKCKDLELGAGVLYKMFGDLIESFDCTTNMIQKACEELSNINEQAIGTVNATFKEFINDTKSPREKCTLIREQFDNVNKAIQLAGEHYTDLHKKFFNLYDKAGTNLGIPFEDFSDLR